MQAHENELLHLWNEYWKELHPYQSVMNFTGRKRKNFKNTHRELFNQWRAKRMSTGFAVKESLKFPSTNITSLPTGRWEGNSEVGHTWVSYSLDPMPKCDAWYEEPSLAKPEPKEKTMLTYIDMTDTPSDALIQKRYFGERINSTFYAKDNEAEHAYGLVDDTPPKTPNELIQRIKDGKITIQKGKEDSVVYDPVRFIRWRDPAVVEDRPGYEACYKTLIAAKTAAEDIIVAKDAEAALAAVKDFENFAVKAN
jgi:hypothetical protein